MRHTRVDGTNAQQGPVRNGGEVVCSHGRDMLRIEVPVIAALAREALPGHPDGTRGSTVGHCTRTSWVPALGDTRSSDSDWMMVPLMRVHHDNTACSQVLRLLQDGTACCH